MQGDTVFFSHSLTTYNTYLESKCLAIIKNRYPRLKVINPRDYNSPTYSSNPKEQFDKEMKLYWLPMVREANALVYFKDDSYSPGVDMEIAEAIKQGIPITNLSDK